MFRGEGSFVSNNVIQVNDEQLTAPKIVIATGTKPIKAPHPKAWTSDDLFPFEGKVPKSISIVGSGFIACELANFFSAVGIETKLLVRSQRILGNEDEDISAIFKEQFSNNVDISFDTTIQKINHDKNKFTLVLANKNKEITTHTCEALLYATGRESNTQSLKLENTTIQTTQKWVYPKR